MFSDPQQRTIQYDRLEGTTLGAWRLETRLGEGGAAVVYLAHRAPGGSSLDAQIAAIKVLHPEAASNPKIRAAFQQEAQIMRKLHHANIVRLYDTGVEHGRAYLAMTYVQGRTLEEMLHQSARLGEIASLDIAIAIARALAAMHRQQIIHRDIKPGNVLIEEGSRRPMLFDLGAAIDLSVHQPVVGEVYGTPAFLSPEQARGDGQIDGRSDIYGLGVTLYRMLAGRKPFYGTRTELLEAQIFTAPPPPSEFGFISPEVEAVVLKAIAKKPDERYADADAFADALLDARAHHREPPSLGQRFRDWLRGP